MNDILKHSNKKELILPCSIGDKIYILKEKTCHMGRTPYEQGNGCLLCDFFWNDMNKCDFCYYIEEETVIGFYINKNGLWIETSQMDECQYSNKETNKISSNLIGTQIFFNKKEAEIHIHNMKTDRKISRKDG